MTVGGRTMRQRVRVERGPAVALVAPSMPQEAKR